MHDMQMSRWTRIRKCFYFLLHKDQIQLFHFIVNIPLYIKPKILHISLRACFLYDVYTPIYKLSTWLFFELHEIIDRS